MNLSQGHRISRRSKKRADKLELLPDRLIEGGVLPQWEKPDLGTSQAPGLRDVLG